MEATTTRCEQLQKPLVYGGHLTLRDKQQVDQLLLAHTEVFALTDYERGETDLVIQSIDTGNSPPIKALPHRLPYILSQEGRKKEDRVFVWIAIRIRT